MSFADHRGLLFRADVLYGWKRLDRWRTEIRFYDSHFELFGWRNGTSFDYSKVENVKEVMVTWVSYGPIEKLGGMFFLAGRKNPIGVVLGDKGYSLRSRKLDKSVGPELPQWLQMKLGKDRYHGLSDQA